MKKFNLCWKNIRSKFSSRCIMGNIFLCWKYFLIKMVNIVYWKCPNSEKYIQENRYEELKLSFIIIKSQEKKSNKENRILVDTYITLSNTYNTGVAAATLRTTRDQHERKLINSSLASYYPADWTIQYIKLDIASITTVIHISTPLPHLSPKW